MLLVLWFFSASREPARQQQQNINAIIRILWLWHEKTKSLLSLVTFFCLPLTFLRSRYLWFSTCLVSNFNYRYYYNFSEWHASKHIIAYGIKSSQKSSHILKHGFVFFTAAARFTIFNHLFVDAHKSKKQNWSTDLALLCYYFMLVHRKMLRFWQMIQRRNVLPELGARVKVPINIILHIARTARWKQQKMDRQISKQIWGLACIGKKKLIKQVERRMFLHCLGRKVYNA